MEPLVAFERRIPHVGTYHRRLAASLERLYENTLDWQHLPYLHRSSFRRIELVAAAGDCWRAWVWPQGRDDGARVMLELALDRQHHRWITTTIAGRYAGSEIWTHAFPLGERASEVVVDFFITGANSANRAALGDFYAKLYRRLYDEDEAMMVERQRQLDHVHHPRAVHHPQALPGQSLNLGPLEEVRRRLPTTVEVSGQSLRLVEVEGKLLAYSAVCPHSMGPLDEGSFNEGIVECPWHGYRFDVRTLECVSGASCRLRPAPAIMIDPVNNDVIITPNG